MGEMTLFSETSAIHKIDHATISASRIYLQIFNSVLMDCVDDRNSEGVNAHQSTIEWRDSRLKEQIDTVNCVQI